MTTTGTYEIDPAKAREMLAELRQTQEVMQSCKASFSSTPVPPGSSPPVVQAGVIAGLTLVYQKCVEAFSKTEEKVGKACDDVENAINAYEATDEQNAYDVQNSVDEDPTGGGSSSSGSDSEESDYRREADERREESEEGDESDEGDDSDSEESEDQFDADDRREELERQKELEEENARLVEENERLKAESATSSATADAEYQQTAKAAQDQAAGIDNKLFRDEDKKLEGWEIDDRADTQHRVDYDGDPESYVSLEAEKDELFARGQTLATQLSDHELAKGYYSNDQLNGIVEDAKTWQSDYDEFVAKHTNLVDFYEADQEKAESTRDDDDDSGSDD